LSSVLFYILCYYIIDLFYNIILYRQITYCYLVFFEHFFETFWTYTS